MITSCNAGPVLDQSFNKPPLTVLKPTVKQQNTQLLDQVILDVIQQTKILDQYITDIIMGQSISKAVYQQQADKIKKDALQQISRIGGATIFKKKGTIAEINAIFKEKNILYQYGSRWNLLKNQQWIQRHVDFYYNIGIYIKTLNKLKKHQQMDITKYKIIRQQIIKKIKIHAIPYDEKSLYSLSSSVLLLSKKKEALVFDTDSFTIKLINNVFYRKPITINKKQPNPIIEKSINPVLTNTNKTKINDGISVYIDPDGIKNGEERLSLIDDLLLLCKYVDKFNQKNSTKNTINWFLNSDVKLKQMKSLLSSTNSCIQFKITDKPYTKTNIDVFLRANLIKIIFCENSPLDCIDKLNSFLWKELQ